MLLPNEAWNLGDWELIASGDAKQQGVTEWSAVNYVEQTANAHRQSVLVNHRFEILSLLDTELASHHPMRYVDQSEFFAGVMHRQTGQPILVDQ